LIVLPARNFARFNLILYILFCLIIRTAYQGVQFELMLKEVRPRDVQSIDELIEKNFTIYAHSFNLKTTENMALSSRSEVD
jgi:hypothetical protein